MGHLTWPCPFRDSLLPAGWDLLWSTGTPNLKLCSPLQRYERQRKIGLGLPAVSQFDRVHMTSYLTFIDTMHLYCTILELQCQKLHILTNHTCIWHHHSNFAKIFGLKTSVPGLSCGVVLLTWCSISCFSRIPIGDRWWDGQTERQRTWRQLIPALTMSHG